MIDLSKDYEPSIPTIRVTKEDRVQIIRHGDPCALPGVCIICKNPPDVTREFIDFGMVMQRYGRIYFCIYCFGQVAIAVGYIKIKGSQLEKAEKYIEQLSVDNTKLKNELAEYADFISRLSDLAGRHTVTTGTFVGGDLNITEDNKESEGAPNSESEADPRVSDSDNNRGEAEDEGINESDSERGSSHIRESSESDEPSENEYLKF
jgi:hypothetical protein